MLKITKTPKQFLIHSGIIVANTGAFGDILQRFHCLETICINRIKCYAFLKFGNLCPKTYDMLDLL